MLHGQVVRPPAIGATVINVDEGSVRGLPGVVKVVVRKNFVGLVTEKPWQALQAAAALKVQWTSGAKLPPQSELHEWMRKQPSRDALVVDSGDIDRTLAKLHVGAEGHVSAPVSNACVNRDILRGGRCPERCGNGLVADAVCVSDAKRRGDAHRLPLEKVRVVFTRGSGCYGINGADTVSFDAALLSQAVAKPVRIQLTRKDEMAWENYGLAYVIDQRIGLDATGRSSAWDLRRVVAIPWRSSRVRGPGNVVTGSLVGFEPTGVTPRAATAPAGTLRNGSNAAPSYIAGCIGTSCAGAGIVKSEARAHAHGSVAVLHRPSPVAFSTAEHLCA